MRVHNVQDYGYQEVAALDTRVNRAYAEAERVLQLIDSITDGNHGVFVKTHHEYTAIYRSAEGKLVRTPLRLVGSVDGMALLQTADSKTPDGVAAVSLLPWNIDDNCRARAVGFLLSVRRAWSATRCRHKFCQCRWSKAESTACHEC